MNDLQLCIQGKKVICRICVAIRKKQETICQKYNKYIAVR